MTNYDEETVARTLEMLQNKGLVTRISGAGHRVEKFAHRLGEKLNLGRRELALLCVLMLRGPQTVGELRGRTERMHDFTDMEEVEGVLGTLEEQGLVARAARGRWAHLFSGVPEAGAEVEAAAPVALRSGLEDRVAALEREVEELKRVFGEFRRQFE